MKNIKDIGKDAKPHLRDAIIDSTPDDCLGGCPECGDYVMPEGENAKCVYCEFTEPLEIWNKRD